MAKKTRKPNLPQETLERARREMERAHGGSTPVVVDTPVAQTSAAARRPATPMRAASGPISATPEELRAQYSYVISDLRNMAALASVLLIALVVLSFFI